MGWLAALKPFVINFKPSQKVTQTRSEAHTYKKNISNNNNSSSRKNLIVRPKQGRVWIAIT